MMDLTAGAGRVWADERKPIRHLDPVLLVVTALLTVIGFFLLYSATHQTLTQDGLDPFLRVNKQIVTAVLGVVILLVTAVFDYRYLKVYAGFIYGASVLSLILVRIPGLGSTDATGTAQRWFQIGGLQITPSEFTKIAMIVMLAAMLSELKHVVPTVQDLVRVLVAAAVPLLLVFIQPDIGTSIVLVAIVVGILLVAGTRVRDLAILGVVSLVLLVGAFQLGVIKDYQVARLTVFLDAKAGEHSESDLASAAYNLRQAEIAVGAGGLTGRGYLGGTQTNLDYVPEQHTDFIFTVAGEEFGFVGAMAVLALFAILLWRAIRIAFLAKDQFGTLLAAGVASMFAIQMFVNVGMVIGIMPITGIPLPFVSYGGTSMLVCFAAIGILLNVHMRRFK
jgi:rod shape determining protein RodA